MESIQKVQNPRNWLLKSSETSQIQEEKAMESIQKVQNSKNWLLKSSETSQIQEEMQIGSRMDKKWK